MTNRAWVQCPKPRPEARLRLYCLPYAGGGAASFRTWSDDLPQTVEVRCILPPGRECRLLEPAFDHMTPLVQEALRFLEPELERPYAFFGHSMGALIAFELTRELRRRAAPGPVHLFASGHRAPQLEDSHPPVSVLDDAGFVKEVDRRYGAIPMAVQQNEELLELMLPGLRSDISVCDSYQYRPEAPLACPIDVLGGEDDDVAQADLEAWRQQTRAAFVLTILPGDHFFLKTAHSQLMHVISGRLAPLAGPAFGPEIDLLGSGT